MNKEKDIFERMLEGGIIHYDNPQFYKITEGVGITMKLSAELNQSTNPDAVRQISGEIIGQKVDETTTVFIPFHTNFGRFITIRRLNLSHELTNFTNLRIVTCSICTPYNS